MGGKLVLLRLWQFLKIIAAFYHSRLKVFRIVVPVFISGVIIFLLVTSGYQIQRTRAIYLYKILPIGILPRDCESAIQVAHIDYALNPLILPSAVKDGYFSIEEFDSYIKSRIPSDELAKTFESFTAAAFTCGLPTDYLASLLYKFYRYSTAPKSDFRLTDQVNNAGELYQKLTSHGY